MMNFDLNFTDITMIETNGVFSLVKEKMESVEDVIQKRGKFLVIKSNVKHTKTHIFLSSNVVDV